MSRYSDQVLTLVAGVNVPVQGVSIYVYTRAGALATLTEDGSGSLDNPVTSDEYGNFHFNTADGLYDLSFHYGGKEIDRWNGVQVGVGPALPDDIVAALAQSSAAAGIGTADGTVQGDLDALTALNTLGQSQPQTAYFHARMAADTYDVAVLFAGDSTGDATNEKFYRWAQAEAALFPEKTIVYRPWNDGAGTWGSPVTIATGTGARTLYVDNFSVSGASGYRIEGARAAAIFDGTRDYALAVWSYGHNYGTTVYEEDIGPSFIGQIAVFMRYLPRAGILLTLQNPRLHVDVSTDTAPQQTANAVAATLKAAMLLGCGIVDEYHAFQDDPAWGIAPGQPGSLYLDDGAGTHHSIPAGVTVALNALLRATAAPANYTHPSPQRPSPLLVKRRNFVPNAIFSDWPNGASVPTGWTFANCTPSKDAGRIEDAPYSLRCTNGAGAVPLVSRDISAALFHLKGKYATAVALVWKAATLDPVGGRIFLTASIPGAQVSATSPQRLPGESVDGWHVAMTTLLIPQNATGLSVSAFTGALDGSDNGEFINFDHIAVFEGVLPGQIDPEDFAASVLDELYNDSNVGIPTGYDGTLSASGGAVSISGATAATTARAYINLPGTVAGETYLATWSHISDTPGNGGVIEVRQGLNGAGSISSSATWSTETLTFVAPSGPCCLLIDSNSLTTAFSQDSWSIKSLSTGFDAFEVPLTSGRNASGSAIDATGGSGLFKIVLTPGTSLYLEGEGAQNNTKTDTATFEITLPKDYIAGRAVTLTVNAIVAGSGTLGSTKTLTLTAYEIANDGTQGGNLGPSAKTLTTSAADYAFTITGTSLAPGDRVLLKLAASINETGNVNPIEVRLNSARLS